MTNLAATGHVVVQHILQPEQSTSVQTVSSKRNKSIPRPNPCQGDDTAMANTHHMQHGYMMIAKHSQRFTAQTSPIVHLAVGNIAQQGLHLIHVSRARVPAQSAGIAIRQNLSAAICTQPLPHIACFSHVSFCLCSSLVCSASSGDRWTCVLHCTLT